MPLSAVTGVLARANNLRSGYRGPQLGRRASSRRSRASNPTWSTGRPPAIHPSGVDGLRGSLSEPSEAGLCQFRGRSTCNPDPAAQDRIPSVVALQVSCTHEQLFSIAEKSRTDFLSHNGDLKEFKVIIEKNPEAASVVEGSVSEIAEIRMSETA